MKFRFFKKDGTPLPIDSSNKSFISFSNISINLFETEKIFVFEEVWQKVHNDISALPCSIYDGTKNLILLLQFILGRGIVTLSDLNKNFFHNESFTDLNHNLDKVMIYSNFIEQILPDFENENVEFKFRLTDEGLNYLNEYFVNSEYETMTKLGFEKRLITPRFDFYDETGENMYLFFKWSDEKTNVLNDEIFLYNINTDNLEKFINNDTNSNSNYEVLPTLEKWTSNDLLTTGNKWKSIAKNFIFDKRGRDDKFTDDNLFSFYHNPLLNNTRVIYDENPNTFPIEINLAINSPSENIYNRTLEIYTIRSRFEKEINEITGTETIKKDIYNKNIISNIGELILKVELEGETIGEDERLKGLLDNFGRQIDIEDFRYVQDYNMDDDLIDYIKINDKRKELLLEGDNIFPYLGTYKSFLNGLKWLNYNDIRIREYFYNIQTWEEDEFVEYKSFEFTDDLNTNWEFKENDFKNYTNEIFNDGIDINGTLGVDENGEYIVNDFERVWKKTTRMGLVWKYNRYTGKLDDEGYPIIENKSDFDPESLIIKLYGLKRLLYKYFLPHNARIINLTFEGIYFEKFRLYNSVDYLKIDTVSRRSDFDINPYPKEQKKRNLFEFLICIFPEQLKNTSSNICEVLKNNCKES